MAHLTDTKRPGPPQGGDPDATDDSDSSGPEDTDPATVCKHPKAEVEIQNHLVYWLIWFLITITMVTQLSVFLAYTTLGRVYVRSTDANGTSADISFPRGLAALLCEQITDAHSSTTYAFHESPRRDRQQQQVDIRTRLASATFKMYGVPLPAGSALNVTGRASQVAVFYYIKGDAAREKVLQRFQPDSQNWLNIAPHVWPPWGRGLMKENDHMFTVFEPGRFQYSTPVRAVTEGDMYYVLVAYHRADCGDGVCAGDPHTDLHLTVSIHNATGRRGDGAEASLRVGAAAGTHGCQPHPHVNAWCVLSTLLVLAVCCALLAPMGWCKRAPKRPPAALTF